MLELRISPSGGEAVNEAGLGQPGLGEPGLLSTGRRRYLAVRHPFEALLAAAALVISLPLMLVLALAIVAESPGNPLFRQRRVGLGGREITIYKLRSMYPDAPGYMPKVAIDDPWVTLVGRFLRLSGLDELPQLWSVVRGDLGLIGPRPEMTFLAQRYDAWQLRRHEMRPGVTGWWQVHHRAGDDMRQGISFDMYYLEHVGPLLDLLIVVLTVAVIFSGMIAGLRSAASSPVAAGRRPGA